KRILCSHNLAYLGDGRRGQRERGLLFGFLRWCCCGRCHNLSWVMSFALLLLYFSPRASTRPTGTIRPLDVPRLRMVARRSRPLPPAFQTLVTPIPLGSNPA